MHRSPRPLAPCSASPFNRVRPARASAHRLWAQLLSAQASGKQVQLHVNGGEQNFPVVIVTAVFS
ncbi:MULTISPECIES: hypothetical protein [Lysobacter]|jgi:hypothetical protein|uniref:hypothetical protein n=1 Tax=Lysobacter TaxID=68 RepID=UPI001F3136E5|nr:MULTISPECIES: hypothetical protein [Lysobacter]UJB19488.1 hypothetical protein L1A79_24860 [Lysobacter capsici]UJQ26786.1 hypothetical protein L2D09_15025 [Lysobacter gummosus]